MKSAVEELTDFTRTTESGKLPLVGSCSGLRRADAEITQCVTSKKILKALYILKACE